jgi:hypothetical protein
VIRHGELIHSLLLVGALAALGSAALRLASRCAPDGLERAVSTAALTAAAAVIEALGLGLVGWGGSTAALTLAAVVTFAAAWRWLPAPAVPAGGELAAWWSGLGVLPRAALGAAGGFTIALTLILLHRPEPGYDGVTYHIPEVVGFVQSGHPGKVFHFYYGLPVGNYPLTDEVLLAWMTGIARGFAALTVWSPVSALLAAAGGWLGLRELDVPAPLRVLAIAALLLGPLIVTAMTEPGTDLPAMTWVICCAALCLAARHRPLLLCPAIVAFGLALGTKSTPVLYGLIALGWALWSARDRLRGLGRPLLAAALAAAVVGTPWYIRNLLVHGSPLWPFMSLPWGDPVPPLLQVLSKTMAERFRYTLLDNFSSYMTATAGLVVLLAGGTVVGAASRRRRAVVAALITALGAIVWANSPLTGLPDGDFLAGAVGSTVRYLMPVFAAGAAALALAGSEGPVHVRCAAIATLVAALVWGLVRDLNHSFFLPFTGWLVPGLIAGAVVAVLPLARLRPRLVAGTAWGGRGRLVGVGASVAVAVAFAVVLAKTSNGYLARHTAVASEIDQPVATYLASRPGFEFGHTPVATTPVSFGLLAGDTLGHQISLIAERVPCDRVLGLATRAWVVVRVVAPIPVPGHPGLIFGRPGAAQRCLAPQTPVFQTSIYRVYRGLGR